MTTSDPPQGSKWQRHFVYRKQVLRTTWKLRVSVLFLVLFFFWATGRYWTVAIGHSLTCTEQIRPSDALLLENFDPEYLVYERAAAIQRAGIAARILVPVQAVGDLDTPSSIDQGIARLMSDAAHLSSFETIPIPLIEPISLNAAKRIRDFLVQERVRSIIVVTPGFRSRRSYDVYNAVFTPSGITVHCSPVFGIQTAENWTNSWHGIQDVGLQFLKLQYYRFFVLR